MQQQHEAHFPRAEEEEPSNSNVSLPLVAAQPERRQREGRLGRVIDAALTVRDSRIASFVAEAMLVGYYGMLSEERNLALRAEREASLKRRMRVRRETNRSIPCATGCSAPVHVHFASYSIRPDLCEYKLCSDSCEDPTAAHKSCLTKVLLETGQSAVVYGCPAPDCRGEVRHERLFNFDWKGLWPTLKRMIAWFWCHAFFMPFLCYWPVMLTLWLGALVAYYGDPVHIPHPGLPFMHSFEYNDPEEDIYFAAYNWWHRWVAGLVGYGLWLSLKLSLYVMTCCGYVNCCSPKRFMYSYR